MVLVGEWVNHTCSVYFLFSLQDWRLINHQIVHIDNKDRLVSQISYYLT
jgi:hypothetical protein